MLYRPQQASNKRSSHTKHSQRLTKPTQHGFLLDIPNEVLSAISANLDPASLLSLGESHISFSRHVEEDSTWRGAFEAHYGTDLLFRRCEPTWRREFSGRHQLIQRFAHSRIPSTTFAPLPAPIISRIHLLSPSAGATTANGLLSLSLMYGVIARSVPDTGKTLPGFLDASGSTIGRGIGNPNAELTPNVSACAIASAGGTVHILWGYQTGHIAYMMTNRTMERARRPAAEFRVSPEDHMHLTNVTDVIWVQGNERWAVSGAATGDVKLWDFADPSTSDLLWTSNDLLNRPADGCVKVAANRALGMIVVARKSGTVVIWRGFQFPSVRDVQMVAVSEFPGHRTSDKTDVLTLHIDPFSGAVVVAFRDDLCFYRIDGAVVTAYGAPEGGGILTSVEPCFVAEDGGSSFVFTGDKLGAVNVYDWAPVSHETVIPPARSFQASSPPSFSIVPSAKSKNRKAKEVPTQHKQESITALAWTPSILVTGTSAGVVVVWDSLTFERIRVIVRAPGLRRRQRVVRQPEGAADEVEAVRQILVGQDEDTVFVNVGGEVITWRAGDVGSPSATSASGHLKGGKMHTGQSSFAKPLKGGFGRLAGASGRWSEHLEMRHAMSESHAFYKSGQLEVDKAEREARRQRENYEKAHRKLGLSESEALEYAMMLSREGGIHPASGSASIAGTSSGGFERTDDSVERLELCAGDALTDEQVQAAIERGLFVVDEDTARALGVGVGTSTPTPSPPASSGRPKDVETEFPSFAVRIPPQGATTPVSPPLSSSIEDSPCISSSPTHPASLITKMPRRDSIGSSVSTLSSLSAKSGNSTSSRGSSERGSVWGKPLDSVVRTPPRQNVRHDGCESRGRASASVGGGGGQAGGLDDMDDDLRFALELSLAEARSRGEGL